MDWTRAAEIATTLAGVVAILAGPVAVWTYRKAARTRRAEWLASLHEKFFETDRYSSVRRVLDYETEPDSTHLKAAVSSDGHHPLADELFRYLNFFEFLASLKALGQVSDREISALFDYDLQMLTRHRFVLDILKPQGFEHLDELLRHQRRLPPSP